MIREPLELSKIHWDGMKVFDKTNTFESVYIKNQKYFYIINKIKITDGFENIDILDCFIEVYKNNERVEYYSGQETHGFNKFCVGNYFATRILNNYYNNEEYDFKIKLRIKYNLNNNLSTTNYILIPIDINKIIGGKGLSCWGISISHIPTFIGTETINNELTPVIENEIFSLDYIPFTPKPILFNLRLWIQNNKNSYNHYYNYIKKIYIETDDFDIGYNSINWYTNISAGDETGKDVVVNLPLFIYYSGSDINVYLNDESDNNLVKLTITEDNLNLTVTNDWSPTGAYYINTIWVLSPDRFDDKWRLGSSEGGIWGTGTSIM